MRRIMQRTGLGPPRQPQTVPGRTFCFISVLFCVASARCWEITSVATLGQNEASDLTPNWMLSSVFWRWCKMIVYSLYSFIIFSSILFNYDRLHFFKTWLVKTQVLVLPVHILYLYSNKGFLKQCSVLICAKFYWAFLLFCAWMLRRCGTDFSDLLLVIWAWEK